MCFKCHQVATGIEHPKAQWWLYLVGDRRFLQPYASPAVQNLATECVPMNPASVVAKDTIDPPFTIEAQGQILERLAAKLGGESECIR